MDNLEEINEQLSRASWASDGSVPEISDVTATLARRQFDLRASEISSEYARILESYAQIATLYIAVDLGGAL